MSKQYQPWQTPWVEKKRHNIVAKRAASASDYGARQAMYDYNDKKIGTHSSGPHITPAIRKERKKLAARAAIRAAGKSVVHANRLKKIKK